jgi:pyridoxal phosphate enzyme (YggS family)
MALSGLSEVRRRIEAACMRAGIPSDAVTLVAVSKGRSDDAVLAAHREGQRFFGENREQGLRARTSAGLPDDIVWHFIGPLQSRKVPFVATHCELLHSLDRMKVARLWSERSDVPVLVQFNLAGEPQKAGFPPDTADRVVDDLLDLGLAVRGVMAIPPLTEEPDGSRPWFTMLRAIFDRYHDRYDGIDTCSMGMTNDFEVAIEEGSTMVRVGRAIFDHATPDAVAS